MKKLYTLAIAALAALSMNAGTLYLVGSGTVDGKSLGGSPNGNCLAITSSTNVYTFNVNKVGWLKISDTNASDWATFNKNGFTINGKGDYAIKSSELGTSFNLWYSNGSSEGTNNINPPSDGEYTYTLTVGTKGQSNSTLVVTAKGEQVITYDFYLRGSWDNYGYSANYKFEQVEGDDYQLEKVTLSKGTTFKIADANWGSINYGNGQSVNANTSYTLNYNGNDMTLNQDINNATIKFNIDTAVMYIEDSTAEPDVPVEPNYSSWWVNLGGEFNNNDFYNDGVQPVDKIATFTDQAIGQKGFKIKTYDGEDHYYIYAEEGKVPTDEWVDFAEDAYDINSYIADAPADGIYTVKYNVATNQIYIEQTGGGTDIPTPPTPTTYDVYVVGGANGWDLESTAYQFERQGETNVYTLTSDEAFAQEWKIRIDPKDWDLTYGAGEGLTLTPDTNIDAWCGSSNNFSAIEGKVTLTFTLVDGSYEAFGSTPATFKYTVESTDIPTPPTPTTYDVYVVGGANGWDLESTAYQFERQGETNVYTLTSDEAFAQEWKIRIDPKDWDLTYGASEGLTLTPDTNIDAWCGSSNNFPAIEGKVTLTFTLVDGSYEAFGSTPATFKYTVESTEEPTPEEPLNATFDFSNYAGMKEASPYIPAQADWTDAGSSNISTPFNGATIDGASVSIETNGGNTPIYYITSGTSPKYDLRYYAGNILTISVPSSYTLTYIDFNCENTTASTVKKMGLVDGQPGTLDDSTSKHMIWNAPDVTTFAATSDKITSVKFNTTGNIRISGITVKADVVTGVEEVEIDANAPVEYYNLQGIRVANPEKGIYIVRQGNKVTKILK